MILGRLRIKDAVRTSILSTKWRYKWVSVPTLIFDLNCFPNRYKNGSLVLDSKKVVNIMHHVFLHHVGPIQKCSLDLSMPFSNTDHYDYISCWILLLSSKGLKDLFLDFYSMRGYYEVPACLFYCQGLCHLKLFGCNLIISSTFNGLTSLKFLQLKNCILEVSQTFKCFKSLTNLCVEYIETLDEDGGDLARLISECPSLERLTLETDGHLWPLQIHAPNLHYLFLKGRFADLSLWCPLLADVSLGYLIASRDTNHLTEDDETCNFVKVLGPLHAIQRLVMDFAFLKVYNSLL